MEDNIPQKYRPISAWGYFGYNLLFNVPIIGWIFAIVYACSDENINRRNFARSYFCIYAIVAAIIIISMVFFASAVMVA